MRETSLSQRHVADGPSNDAGSRALGSMVGLSEGREGAAYIPGMSITSTTALEALADDVLLERVRTLADDSRRIEADPIAHLAEVDARGLLARHAVSSTFGYCSGAMPGGGGPRATSLSSATPTTVRRDGAEGRSLTERKCLLHER